MPPKYYEYEEEYTRRRRDQSPDYYSGGAPKINVPQDGPPYPGGAPPYVSTSRLEETYGPPPPRDPMTLEAPPAQQRPRSVPPPTTAMMVRRGRSRADSSSSSDSDRRSRSRRGKGRGDRSPSPITRVRGVVDDNFSNSSTGIGAGLLGAVVGGLVAKEASDAATRRKHREKGYSDEEGGKARLVSTILGAVAGGLGANAIANRVEDSREKDRLRQKDWERKFGRDDDLPRYDSGRVKDSRPRDFDNGRDRDRRPRYEDDDDYDFVYDEPRYDDRRVTRRRSEDNYRYKQ